MKYRVLFFVIVVCLWASAKAEETESVKEAEGVSTGLNSTLEVEEKIQWIEEKINPTTRRLENLAKPFTAWIEGQIHGREKTDARRRKRIFGDQRPGIKIVPGAGDKISAERAVELVGQHISGEILKIKYVSGVVPHYRVKLISTVGKIHIFRIHVLTGDFLQSASMTKKQE